jgi:hypothetical protein
MARRRKRTRLLRVRVLQGARGLLRGILRGNLVGGVVEAEGYADGSTVWEVLVWTELTADLLQEVVWGRNGGGWCEVREMELGKNA